ncbi:MAG: EamA family transporter [Holdemanella sp.]|nr:EamA family transporter [Holdemanella sp.]
MSKYVIVALISGVISAVSQILLKKSSSIPKESKIKEYLNPYVICGYGMVFLCMILMVIAYKGLPFKYGAVLESLVYFYVMILGKVFLKEKLTAKRIIGNAFIVVGVAVFSF